jgi:hypothetical protein
MISLKDTNKKEYFMRRHLVSRMLHQERTNEIAQKVKSKKALQTMLKLDEIMYSQTDVQHQQQRGVSRMLNKLILTKVEFGIIHTQDIKETILGMFKISMKISDMLTDFKTESVKSKDRE